MFRILTKSLLVVHEPLVEWASRIRLLHLMRDYQTLCVLRQCIGLIGWYLWDENERASAARLQATQAKIAAPDASVKHELLNQEVPHGTINVVRPAGKGSGVSQLLGI